MITLTLSDDQGFVLSDALTAEVIHLRSAIEDLIFNGHAPDSPRVEMLQTKIRSLMNLYGMVNEALDS